ncbi:MAG TPA: right-handed parallel beta-helix repeat-containing protein [Tepidisphaeraceae bacterium]|nr:right-handed parallel beta-helix repeat-containing protein [Tepidisphaeraceae bacterium]
MFVLRPLIVGLTLNLYAPANHAADIPVAPAPGAVAKALAAAAPGDTLRLVPGTYAETVTINKPVTLLGGPGVVLDPSVPFKPDWKPAADIGPGVFRAAVKQRPRTLFLNGKIVAEVDFREAGESGDWGWKTLLAKGPPRAGFKFIPAIWGYHAGQKAVYLRAPDAKDPATLALTQVTDNVAVVSFRDVDGAALRGVTIAHGFAGVSVGEGARRCVVADCAIGPWDRTGVSISAGASENVVERNRVTRGALEDWAPGDGSKERYEIWQLHKSVGHSDRIGVQLFRAGRANVVRHNHVHETFDGVNVGDYTVESLDKPLPRPDDGRETAIHDNLIERTRDSGIEIGGGAIDVHVYGNVLRQTHGGLRFKVPRVGPVYIHHNVLDGGAPFNVWFSMDDAPARGYVYHNTIVGGTAGVQYSSFVKPHNIGTPNWHFVNNLVVTKNGFFGNRKVEAPVNFAADYNVVVGGGKPYPKDAAKDAHSKYVEKVELEKDLRPSPTGPAIDSGIDLSTYLDGKPLPGCPKGYFKGAAPDAGAFEVK